MVFVFGLALSVFGKGLLCQPLLVITKGTMFNVCKCFVITFSVASLFTDTASINMYAVKVHLRYQEIVVTVKK